MIDISLSDELNKIDNIPIDQIVIDHIENVILSSLFLALKDGEKLVKLNIGIGDIYINFELDSITYKFIPSKSFLTKIKNIYDDDAADPLIDELNEKINKKLYKLYRELLK